MKARFDTRLKRVIRTTICKVVVVHRLVEKRNEYLIQSNHQLRKDERKHLKRSRVKTGATVLGAGVRSRNDSNTIIRKNPKIVFFSAIKNAVQKSTHNLEKEKAYQKAAKK
jgi:hypothetical protein